MRDATKINDYFYGAKTLFIIPLYQRKYAWQQKHCLRLFEDLKKFIEIICIAIFLEVLFQQKQARQKITY